jgi:hypothetical protein
MVLKKYYTKTLIILRRQPYSKNVSSTAVEAGGVEEGGRGSGIGMASRREAMADGIKEGSRGSGIGAAALRRATASVWRRPGAAVFRTTAGAGGIEEAELGRAVASDVGEDGQGSSVGVVLRRAAGASGIEEGSGVMVALARGSSIATATLRRAAGAGGVEEAEPSWAGWWPAASGAGRAWVGGVCGRSRWRRSTVGWGSLRPSWPMAEGD